MIPEFPQFTPLRLGHRAAVNALTRRFPPYSDFNFTSLYSWDSNETVAISLLEGNLVVRFVDYTTQEPFYSFLGDRNVDATARKLLEFAQAEGLRPELKLVPESVAVHLHDRSMRAVYDDDNRDYILSIERLKRYQGNKLGPKRNFVNRFNRSYEAVTVRVDLSEVAVQTRVLDLFHRWVLQKGNSAENPDNELLALHRVMFAARYLDNLYVIATFIEDDMAAFAINEVLGDGFGMIHFEKADASYTGVYATSCNRWPGAWRPKGAVSSTTSKTLGSLDCAKANRATCPRDSSGSTSWLRARVRCVLRRSPSDRW